MFHFHPSCGSENRSLKNRRNCPEEGGPYRDRRIPLVHEKRFNSRLALAHNKISGGYFDSSPAQSSANRAWIVLRRAICHARAPRARGLPGAGEGVRSHLVQLLTASAFAHLRRYADALFSSGLRSPVHLIRPPNVHRAPGTVGSVNGDDGVGAESG